jgi:hypothetical protein
MGADVVINFDLADIEKATRKLLQPTMKRIGLHAMREAKANAPRSPTARQISATLVRKRRTKRKPTPGGLEKSITYSVEFGSTQQMEAHIFVPRNSAAGAYARVIHDMKGVRWHNRGIGTRAKGARADEKFVARAVKDNLRRYSQLIALTVEKATKETNSILGGSHGKN